MRRRASPGFAVTAVRAGAPVFPLPSKWLVTIGEPIPAPPRPDSFTARSAAAHAAVQALVDRERRRRDTPFW
ncbi:hypothetical protein MTF65_04055 [Streptomyces sp. APSN-46.1]|uniref:hypothetical protein n=1 Tax=Streptomyces sp. APSN-46.1 TaxID=2929049 RepID=UPI001FB31F93|nr:hypothetical protein [Streptomyces sp. APSN-46.1]MCJ1676534.1 hypothetical protein [Streptomyces sp. APSN-46.1]